MIMRGPPSDLHLVRRISGVDRTSQDLCCVLQHVLAGASPEYTS